MFKHTALRNLNILVVSTIPSVRNSRCDKELHGKEHQRRAELIRVRGHTIFLLRGTSEGEADVMTLREM